MSRLGSGLSRFFGRVEILARGAEPFLKGAELSLERGDPLEARAQARSLLSRVPGSPLGLALWADAAEACGFHEEVVEALAELVVKAPWRQEIWLRLGNAGLFCGWEDARSALERAAAGRDAPEITRRALLRLADLDLVDDEPSRASRWLERVASHPSQPDPGLALRRAECAMALGKWDEARLWVDRAGDLDGADRDDLGGRFRLLHARAKNRWPDIAIGSDPISLALSAYLLGTAGSDTLLVQLVAGSRDAALIARARETVDALENIDEPRWKAAFALAEGRRGDARAALVDASRRGDRDAAASLAAHAIRWRDMVAVSAVAEQSASLLPPDVALLWKAQHALGDGDHERALAQIEQAWQIGGDAEAWAEAEVRRVIGGWLAPAPGGSGPESGPAGSEASAWDRILGELHRVARALERRDLAPAIEALAVERDRPLYVAILGEFNAGKSTLINALLSTDVAPTGVRPTTASLHWVAWAPDPFARVVVRGGPDRVVGHHDLKATLDRLRDAGEKVERVFIYAPVERLKRIEILDTPGFNAPDTTHAEEARRGVEEAHVALWLLDATAPLKDSERQVIERVAAAGVPMQVLVNKRDRLDDHDLEKVMAYVERSLETTGIASLAPPVAMSAQLALRGRLGDEDALARSGWPQVEALLAEHVVNVADALRERALRRKAARIAESLTEVADERSRADRDHGAEQNERAEVRSRIVATLRGEQSTIANEIAEALAPALAELRRDMIPIDQLPEESRGDAEVKTYVIDKTIERLTPAVAAALTRALERRGEIGGFEPVALEPTLRGVLGGAAAAFGGRPPIDGAPLVGALSVALAMSAETLEAAAPDVSLDRSRLAASLRIRALADALNGSPATP